MKYNHWYKMKIEDPLKKIVYKLRNNGINTFQSCGHDLYIDCEFHDPTEELIIIYNVFHQLKIKNYKVVLISEQGHFAKQYMQIQIADKNGNYHSKTINNEDFEGENHAL